jgi:magnesium chelatase family protein
MMLAKVRSGAIVGLDGVIVEVEVDILPGLPKVIIVGLPDTAVEESSERVRSAIRNSGGIFPMRRIVVNLAPADLKKAGPAYDLSIAVGILLSSEQVSADVTEMMFLGELSLDGSLRHTNGILPLVGLAKDEGIPTIIVPEADAREASLIEGIKVIPMASLAQLVGYLQGDLPAPEYRPDGAATPEPTPASFTDLADIKGQEHVKRALEVAAAGGHNLIICGPPGSGKTLLARSLPSILPPMTNDEALEVTKIYSVSGLLPSDTPLIRQRPFRAPHYTISNAGLVGGGHFPRPGEISLSHRGVLFLDELPEFGHSLLEVLRQPLEDKIVTISRAQGRVTFPSSFMLVGAMNPCPCGYYGDPFRKCTCPSGLVSRYQQRISGPFIDRVDIFVEVPHIDYEKLADNRRGETSAKVQARVSEARDRQLRRFRGTPLTSNAEMTPAEIRDLCKIDDAAQGLLQAAMKQLYLSARAFHRILKLSLTIADLEDSDVIKAQHIAEAIQYRPRRTE